MVNEVLKNLINSKDGIYVDGTTGSGGHSEAIGNKISPKGRLICLDRDPEAIKIARKRLNKLDIQVDLVNVNYARIGKVLKSLGIEKIHGVLLDLGMSSYQLDRSGRGFSFNKDEILDMRMDLKTENTARDLINALPSKEIERILLKFGEERKARAIARAIDRERRKAPIETTGQLADIIRSVIPPSRRPGSKDPSTRTFQALRIAVNNELEELSEFLKTIPPIIETGGRLVFLSYHSLEDRLVKQAMAGWEKGCICPPDLPKCACGNVSLFRKINKKGIKPADTEIEINPRARSATLRAAERI
jgi:16S rRNA (cytosine1402-N4)-methyltransferase